MLCRYNLPHNSTTNDTSCAFRGLVIDQTRKGGFRFYTVDELAVLRVAVPDGTLPPQSGKQMYDYQQTDERLKASLEKVKIETRSLRKKSSDDSV